MNKKVIVAFFTVIFMAFIAAPSIITLLDDSIDTSIFYSLAEEEEEKGSEKDKNIEILFSKTKVFESYSNLDELEDHSAYFFKKYGKPHLNLISPPPDLS